MKVVSTPRALRREIARLKKGGRTIGFVPTMGFLHDGHLVLVRKAKKDNGAAVVSIFVNPLQFGPREDYGRYPRNLGRDAKLLRSVKTDLLFVPRASTLYPKGSQTRVSVGDLSRPLCGATRPGHFAGVATVVLKLLNLVAPDVLYLGQKDYQQFRVVERMVRDFDLSVKVRMAPIVREADGLAMSSRNVNLSFAERLEARCLYRALKKVKESVLSGERRADRLRDTLRRELGRARGACVDYAEIVDAGTLRRVTRLSKDHKIFAAVAVFFQKTRLIDNFLITV